VDATIAAGGTTQQAIVGLTSTELMGAETAAWIAQRTQKVFDRGEEKRSPNGDLFLRPNDDGLFLGFTQTWRADE